MELNFSEKYFLFNSKLLEISVSEIAKGEVAVYEVIKIVSGIPLFYEDHIKRLNNSMKMAHIEGYIISNSEFIAQINTICKANNQYFGNIELFVTKLTDNKINSYIGFIPSKYPEPISYINGVLSSLLIAERITPNAKIKGSQTRLKANNQINNSHVYEVILVNNEGFITEGSRSNVFFIKDNIVYSAPQEYILPGITRKYAINALQTLNIQHVEKLVGVKELASMDAAFLCGTSPGILPIKQIDELVFDVQNKIMRNCMLEFNAIVQAYLTKNS